MGYRNVNWAGSLLCNVSGTSFIKVYIKMTTSVKLVSSYDLKKIYIKKNEKLMKTKFYYHKVWWVYDVGEN